MRSSLLNLTIAALLLIAIASGCGSEKPQATTRAGTSGPPKTLDYGTLTALTQDMKDFAAAIQSRDGNLLNKINDRYSGALFQADLKPLLYQVYPDPAGKSVVFLIYTKDPRTGSDYLLHFDRKLPAVDAEVLELQIRTKDPNTPLNCIMEVPAPQTYVKEYEKHDIVAHYTFSKQFLQSGTYDFDAIRYTSYRTHGYPFVVMDLLKTQLEDRTINAKTECRQ
jgi:hypothetical protein